MIIHPAARLLVITWCNDVKFILHLGICQNKYVLPQHNISSFVLSMLQGWDLQWSCLSCQVGIPDWADLLMGEQTNLFAKIQDFVLHAAVGPANKLFLLDGFERVYSYNSARLEVAVWKEWFHVCRASQPWPLWPAVPMTWGHRWFLPPDTCSWNPVCSNVNFHVVLFLYTYTNYLIPVSKTMYKDKNLPNV